MRRRNSRWNAYDDIDHISKRRRRHRSCGGIRVGTHMASAQEVALGSVAFAAFWVLAVFPSVPFLPIGRTAGSLLGALLMVVFRVISPKEAYAAIDLPIVGLLFGTMLVSAFLERADMFRYLGRLLSWKSRGGKDLLVRVCVVSALSSALFTNDTCCVVLTEFILKIAKQNKLPPQPFLLALASSANIGSAATPIGNPQNLVIAVQSGISFGRFLAGVFPAMILGVLVNVIVLLCFFWNYLSQSKDEEADAATAVAAEEVVADEDVVSHRFSPARMSHASSSNYQEVDSTSEQSADQVHMVTSLNGEGNVGSRSHRSESGIHIMSRSRRAVRMEMELVSDGITDNSREQGTPPRRTSRSSTIQRSVPPADNSILGDEQNAVNNNSRWQRILGKASVYLVTVGMLISLLMGLDMSWTAIAAAVVLIIIDFKDAGPCLEKVSYSLLIFFCGMFITVEGFNKTGIPNALWQLVEPHARIDSAKGVTILALMILLLSNVASNVPTVLLLGSRVATAAAAVSPSDATRAWLMLAWVSTVAGNLSLLGSAANLIVCEQARRAQFFSYNLSFFSHLRFGVPSTLIVTTAGLLLVLVC